MSGPVPKDPIPELPIPKPRYVPVADHGLLVELAPEISDEASDLVMALDRALAHANVDGITEVVPAFVNLLVVFDPLVLDHMQVRSIVSELLPNLTGTETNPNLHQVPVCYDDEFGRDLATLAAQSRLSIDAVIKRHLAGEYRVAMFGFAPGYAYLSGVPGEIQVPRKTAAVPAVPAGSVIVAGPQCLITTMEMPTGWTIIGRSPQQILQADSVLFEVGDRVRFVRIDRATYESTKAQP